MLDFSKKDNYKIKRWKSDWRFDKINPMTVYFYETTELKGSSFLKFPFRSSAIVNIEKNW